MSQFRLLLAYCRAASEARRPGLPPLHATTCRLVREGVWPLMDARCRLRAVAFDARLADRRRKAGAA
jgi:hypothetical protein